MSITPGTEPVSPAPGERYIGSALTENPEGITLTHTMIRISDPKKSLAFYTGLFKMSFLFSMNAGPFTIYYLGHAGDTDQSPGDILKAGTRTGLLELIHVPTVDTARVGDINCITSLGSLGHLGFKVSDVKALLEQAQKSGYTVLKPVPHVPTMTVGIHEGVSSEHLHSVFATGYSQVGFLADPDGHCIEILPLRLG